MRTRRPILVHILYGSLVLILGIYLCLSSSQWNFDWNSWQQVYFSMVDSSRMEECPLHCHLKECHFSFLGPTTETSSDCSITVAGQPVVQCQHARGSVLLVLVAYHCEIINVTSFDSTNAPLAGISNLREYLETMPTGTVTVGLANMVTSQQEAILQSVVVSAAQEPDEKLRWRHRTVAFVWKKGYKLTRVVCGVKSDSNTTWARLEWNRSFYIGKDFPVSTDDVTMQELERGFSDVRPGGHHTPTTCRPRQTVALVFPFKGRDRNLRTMLSNIIPFLKKQNTEFTIYVVEQTGPQVFNKAILMNIGFLEARKAARYDYYVFHDVDKIPEDTCNLYACEEKPRHLMAAYDQMNYRLPYYGLLGGVMCLTSEQMENVNGYSNVFFGWGGEDDDMYRRLMRRGYRPATERYPPEIGRYTGLPHRKDKFFPPSNKRINDIDRHTDYMEVDGLSTTQNSSRVLAVNTRPLYTHILVKVQGPVVGESLADHFKEAVRQLDRRLQEHRTSKHNRTSV